MSNKLSIKQLEQIMVEQGLVIRAIPYIKRYKIEVRHKDKYPNGRIEFLPEYGREMLIVEEVNRNGGKFIIEKCNDTLAIVRFSGKVYYDSIEEAVNSIIKESVKLCLI